MTSITLGGIELNYTLKRGRRRNSIQIKVATPALIEVTAPSGLSAVEIEALLKKRSAWIITQLARLQKLADNPVNLSVGDGAQLLFLGRVLRLKVLFSAVRRPKVTLQEDCLTVLVPLIGQEDSESVIRSAVKKWYLKAAAEIFAAKTEYWAAEIGVRPRRITIREQKTRWGSASPRGIVNYNWRIVMAPPAVVDYLVVHELCHIKVPNHSGDFWLLVGQSAPEYKEHRAWLRRHGALLMRFLSD